jgi:hypothetical protein
MTLFSFKPMRVPLLLLSLETDQPLKARWRREAKRCSGANGCILAISLT